MIWTAAVTFESQTRPPETIRVEVEAVAATTAGSRAIRAALKQCPGKHFQSLSVLLERPEQLSATMRQKRPTTLAA